MPEPFVYTGVSATTPEEQLFHAAAGFGLAACGDAQQKLIHKCAIKHGLPEIPGFYGYDFERHEFLRMPFEILTPRQHRALELAFHIQDPCGEDACTLSQAVLALVHDRSDEECRALLRDIQALQTKYSKGPKPNGR